LISFPRRACREFRGTARTRAITHARGRPPRRESRTAAVPPAGPPRHHRRPEIDAGIRGTQKIPPKSFLFFPKISPVKSLTKKVFKILSSLELNSLLPIIFSLI
jgi:hypothetical protein